MVLHDDRVQVFNLVGALIVLAWAGFSAWQSHFLTAAVWAGLGLVLTWSAFRPKRTVSGPQDVTVSMRLYGIAASVALLVLTAGLIVAAARADSDVRGSFIGLAVLVGSGGLALTALVVAMERKIRAWRRTEESAQPRGG